VSTGIALFPAGGRSMARDILALGGPDSTVKNLDTNDAPASTSTSQQSKRHRRMSEGADDLTPEPTGLHRGSGATGIDMGSGGEGTDLE
jgi:hypothetical protein